MILRFLTCLFPLNYYYHRGGGKQIKFHDSQFPEDSQDMVPPAGEEGGGGGVAAAAGEEGSLKRKAEGEPDEEVADEVEEGQEEGGEGEDGRPRLPKGKVRNSFGDLQGKSPKRQRPKKFRGKRVFWTEREEGFLRKACVQDGMIGQWARILEMYPFQECRTSVDLKDKWRNMQKIAGAGGERVPRSSTGGGGRASASGEGGGIVPVPVPPPPTGPLTSLPAPPPPPPADQITQVEKI